MTTAFKDFLSKVTNTELSGETPDEMSRCFCRPAIEDYIWNLFNEQEKLLKQSINIDPITLETLFGYYKKMLIAGMEKVNPESAVGMMLDELDEALVENVAQDFIKRNQE